MLCNLVSKRPLPTNEPATLPEAYRTKSAFALGIAKMSNVIRRTPMEQTIIHRAPPKYRLLFKQAFQAGGTLSLPADPELAPVVGTTSSDSSSSKTSTSNNATSVKTTRVHTGKTSLESTPKDKDPQPSCPDPRQHSPDEPDADPASGSSPHNSSSLGTI